MMISNVLGEFTSITGVLEHDENDITKSKIRASIDAATISTREPQRDAHLKSADFFHVEKHSALTFNSTVISKNADWGAEGQRRPDDSRSDPKRGF
jgi:polyisoprenoid-binding protein YceI